MDWRKLEQLIRDWARDHKFRIDDDALNHDDVASIARYLADNLKPEASKP